jgi:hypothetical protein
MNNRLGSTRRRRFVSFISSTTTTCMILISLALLSLTTAVAFSSSDTALQEVTTRQRQLAIGDFASINQVLRSATFALPPRSGTEDSTTLRLTNIICRNVNLGDVQLDYSIPSSPATTTNDLLDVTIRVIDLDMVCEADYRYNGWLLNGSGDVQVTSRNNDVTLQGSVRASMEDFDNTNRFAAIPPSTITMNACTPSVNINQIDFDNGGFLGWVLNLIEGLARGIMEKLVQDMLCQELQQALENAQGLLEELNAKLDKYSVDEQVDPLQAEQRLPLELDDNDSSNIMASLLDLSNPQTEVGQWVQQALRQGIDYLATTVPDPSPITGAPAGTTSDLQANIWMREFLLNEDRALVLVDPAMDTENEDPPLTVFYNHDELLETTIQLQGIQLLGLDTLKTLDPLSIIGQYTIQSDVSWEYLAVAIDATLDIRPSSLDNAVVSGDDGLVEDMRVVLGLGNVQATMALLAAIHQDILESLQVGSLLSTANILPCLVSTVVELKLSSFSIKAGDIYSPYLSGLDSVGLDLLLDDVLSIVFLLYEDVVLQRSPAFFQQDFRQTLNEQFLRAYLDTASTDCPLPSASVAATSTNAPAGFIDFRDLLLSPVDAWARGGTGTEPYGDLVSSMITPNIGAELGSAEQFNARLIRPATKAQSGVPGALMWSDWVGLDYTSTGNSTSLYDAAVLHISNLRIHNLDTLTDPLNLLDATDWNALYQTLTLEKSSDERPPLNVSASVLFAIGGEASPLAMTNQLDLTLTIPSISLAMGILAHMKTEDLLQFPLVDATNPSCWLATLASYMDQEEQSSTELAPLVLETLSLSLDTFFVTSECITCTSPGAYVLSELLRDELPRFGFQELFTSRIVALAQDVAWHLVEEFDLAALMEEAVAQCPHRTAGSDSNEATGSTIGWTRQNRSQQGSGSLLGSFQGGQAVEMHALSEKSIETVLGLGLVAIQAAIAMVAQNHVLLVEEGSLETLSMLENRTQESSFANSNVADWTNLSAGMGEWADFAFEELRKYILAPIKNERRLLEPSAESDRMNATLLEANTELDSEVSIPRLLSLLQENILDENGIYVMDLEGRNNAAIEAMGVEIVASKVHVQGLDSLSDIDVLIPVQPQVLRNRFHLDELTVVMEATLTFGRQSEALKFVYSIKNITAQLDLLVAIDLDAIQEIQIGSFFNTSNILSCMALGLHDIQIHQLSTTIDEIEGPLLSGFLSSTFQGSVDSILSSMSESYREDVLSAMPILLDSTFKDVINALLPDLVDSLQSDCPAPNEYPKDGLVDFRDLLLPTNASRALGGSGDSAYGDLFQILYNLLEENVLRTGATNRPVVNDIFRHITNEQSSTNGTITVEENAFDTQTRFKIAGLEADFGFQISNVALENVDSIGDPLEIFRPMNNQATVVDNILSFGVDERPVRLAATFVLSLSDGGKIPYCECIYYY